MKLFKKKITQEKFDEMSKFLFNRIQELEKQIELAMTNHTAEFNHIYQYVAKFNAKLDEFGIKRDID